MRVHLLHHKDDAAFVAGAERLLASRDISLADSASDCDVVVVLASRSALRDGLGDGPSAALAAEKPVLPVVLGDDVVPRPYLAARKHIAIATDAPSLLRLLDDWRENASAKIADGKRELFGYGVLLGLLSRVR